MLQRRANRHWNQAQDDHRKRMNDSEEWCNLKFEEVLHILSTEVCADCSCVSFLFFTTKTSPNLRCISSLLCLDSSQLCCFRSTAIAKTGCKNDDAEMNQKLFETSKHWMMGFSYITLVVHHNSHMSIMRKEMTKERKEAGVIRIWPSSLLPYSQDWMWER